jgi:multisubunit Na+/H+ antiporter MnhB subunit
MGINSGENTQYAVLARHRLHYGRLFFEVIAFAILVLLLGTMVALTLPTAWRPGLAICGGGMLLATSFIAYRLNQQEEAYARLLSRIEQSQTGWLPSPALGGVSSRHMMPIGLALAAIALASLGVWPPTP